MHSPENSFNKLLVVGRLLKFKQLAFQFVQHVKERLTQIVVGKKFKMYSDEMLKTAKIDPPLTTLPVAAPAAPAAPAPAPAN
jgi:hypothetical protein